MNELEALILGVLQGLTEFLPVSSSGHIELGKAILGVELEDNLQFSLIVHCATVLSTLIVFRNDILDILKGLFKFEWNEETKFVAFIVVSMIPVTIVGLLFEDKIEAMFTANVLLVGAMLIVTGTLLALTNIIKSREKELGFASAFIVGIAQAIAVLPGISRSGATIATGLMLGIPKDKVARFSFLMVVPPILGKTLLDLKDLVSLDNPEAVGGMPLLVGFLAAFICGLAACTWMIALVKQQKIQYFAFYCFTVGLAAVFYEIWF